METAHGSQSDEEFGEFGEFFIQELSSDDEKESPPRKKARRSPSNELLTSESKTPLVVRLPKTRKRKSKSKPVLNPSHPYGDVKQRDEQSFYQWPATSNPPSLTLLSSNESVAVNPPLPTHPVLSSNEMADLAPLMAQLCNTVGVAAFQRLLLAIRRRFSNSISLEEYKLVIFQSVPVSLFNDVNTMVKRVVKLTVPHAIEVLRHARQLAGKIMPPSSPRMEPKSKKIVSEVKRSGRRTEWALEEDKKFLALLKVYGTDFKKIADAMPGRTLSQIRTHYRYVKKVTTEKGNLLKVRGRPPRENNPKVRIMNEDEKGLVKGLEEEVLRIETEEGKAKAEKYFQSQSGVFTTKVSNLPSLPLVSKNSVKIYETLKRQSLIHQPDFVTMRLEDSSKSSPETAESVQTLQKDGLPPLSLFLKNKSHSLLSAVALPQRKSTMDSLPDTSESAILFGPRGVPLLSLPLPPPGMTLKDQIDFIVGLSKFQDDVRDVRVETVNSTN